MNQFNSSIGIEQLLSNEQFANFQLTSRSHIRAQKTWEKINSLFDATDKIQEPHVGLRMEFVLTLRSIREAVGIYRIPSAKERSTGNAPYLWVNLTGRMQGMTWPIWLGERPTDETNEKWILVLLSDKGVKYLNFHTKIFNIRYFEPPIPTF